MLHGTGTLWKCNGIGVYMYIFLLVSLCLRHNVGNEFHGLFVLLLGLQTEDSLVKSLGMDDGVRAARRIVRMEADAERQELASRIRAKIREEKLANAKLMKAALPNVQGKNMRVLVIPIPFQHPSMTRQMQHARR